MDKNIFFYTVSRIDGDYAVLTLENTEDTILVARALLPLETDEGTRLRFDRTVFSYEIMD